jgi:hypothetical protein
MVTGQADALHVRTMNEVPIHLDDILVELTEADDNRLARQRHHLIWRGSPMTTWADRVAAAAHVGQTLAPWTVRSEPDARQGWTGHATCLGRSGS